MTRYPAIIVSMSIAGIACLILMFSYVIYSFVESSRRSYQTIIEQSFRLGCNESTQYRKLEYCANAASEYVEKRK